MATDNNGVVCKYGIDGSMTNGVVQSYDLVSSFNNEATVVDENGLTITHRLDDRKSELTVEMIVKATSVPVLGQTLNFSVNTASAYPGGSASSGFLGTIQKVQDKGSNKGFTLVSVSATGYESIGYA
jgi:hypothetical protein